MFCTAKIKELKLCDKTQTRSVPRAGLSHQATAHQKLEKRIFILLTGKNATLVRKERRKPREQPQSRAKQITLV